MPSPEELNFLATISSRTDLKSSRNIVSDAHLNTSANRQYGFIPLFALSLAALMTTSVSKKTMDNAMQSNMIPKRLLICTSARSLKLYVFLIELTSFHVVNIHHGSRRSASKGRVRTFALDPRELKYAKFDHASATQKGWTQSSEMIKKDFQPGDDVVQEVGYEEEGGGGGEVPAVHGVAEEDECAVPDGEDELERLVV
jgi:hypothetical protein